MSVWRQLTRGLHALTNRADTDRNVSDEVDDYLENARAAHLARGLSPDEALRAARIEIGGVTNAREQVRRYGWENTVEMILADVRYAGRRFRSNPGFTAVTVVTLAIGIGASTAIFSAVDPILFKSLPYPHAERIAMISDFGCRRRATGCHVRQLPRARSTKSFVRRPGGPEYLATDTDG